jgi:ubiquinone/menaquinone biosynthesis C-methylase UbiE
MISLIFEKLKEMNPDVKIHIYGFDVKDSQVQESNFIDKSVYYLNKTYPDCNWQDKIKIIKSSEKWPFADQQFDFVISNQVLEHVFDHDHFFSEMDRVLKNDGKCVHIFPLKHYIFEGHLNIPFVHRITNWDLLYLYIKICSKLKLGKYKKHKKNNPSLTISDFSEKHADYIVHNTNYITKTELYSISKKYNFRSSFRYSGWMYMNKVRSILKLNIIYKYKNMLFLSIMELLLIRLSSMTFFLEKKNEYR